jgi:hypothetical protein
MTRMSIAPASLALAIALGACGSSGSDNAPSAAPSGGVVNEQPAAPQTPQKSKATPATQQEPAKAPEARTSAPKNKYGVTYEGPKPKPLPANTEPLAGDAKGQALQGSIKRFLAWGNSFYGATVLDTSASNECSDRGADVWSCAVTINVVRPYSGHKAGPIAGGYTVTLDPKTKQLSYASGLS